MLPIKSITTIRYRRIFFSVTEHLLSPAPAGNADITYYIQHPVNHKNALREFYTLLIDLSEPATRIWQQVYHRTRTEITSFLNNRAFEYKLIFNPGPRDLSFFITLFNQFAKSRGIRRAETARLKAYNDYGILGISYLKENNDYAWINFYRITTERAVNIHSFQPVRSALNSTQAGRAHRALHWLDILEFKKLAVKAYDFCGWYHGKDDEHLLRINRFKEQFTQTKIKEYSGVIYTNRLLIALLKLAGRHG